MPESLLQILKICLLAVMFLFFLRVLRVVWTETKPPAPAAVPSAASRTSTAAASTAASAAGDGLHARLFRRDGRLWVEDLGSTNGTFVNRKKVAAPVALRRGDRLQVGTTVLEVTR